jgi:formamidopyrimidine-DNA glycosylase
MGGEILLVTRQTLPEKYRLVFDFDDQRCLAVNFWWFGYAHFVQPRKLSEHKMTAKLGPNALDMSETDLKASMRGKRSRIKSFLLDQSNIAGIGNAYAHDILWFAELHPNRTIDTMNGEDISRLVCAIQDGLQPSLDKGGAFYELNIYGEGGRFTKEDIKIGYKEGHPCPRCGTDIEKIKTGSTNSFICSKCQFV